VLFVVVAVVLAVVVILIGANARARRQLDALNERPDDVKRVGDNEPPPSSGGYLGPVD
jgi:hypothetical protein